MLLTALLSSFLSLHHLNAGHILVMTFSLIPEKEAGASDQGGEAKS